jgi:hypothetical protein
MTIQIRLTGSDPDVAADEAADLLRAIGQTEPQRHSDAAPDSRTRLDPATALGIASLVLSLPGAALATLQIRDRLDRTRLRKAIEALKRRLSATECDGILEVEDVGVVDLGHDSTDAVVDLLLREKD